MKTWLIGAGAVAAAILSLNGLYQILPESLQVLTVGEHKESHPMQLNQADQAVKYQHHNRCDGLGYDTVRLGDAATLYEELAGHPHHYEVWSPDMVCEDIGRRRKARAESKERDIAGVF